MTNDQGPQALNVGTEMKSAEPEKRLRRPRAPYTQRRRGLNTLDGFYVCFNGRTELTK